MKITAIRHLITDWNRKGLLQGTEDIEVDLNDEDNERLIDSLRRDLASESFDAVFVSPLKRTRSTAELLGYSNYRIDPLLVEINFGKYEGLEKSKMIKELGSQWFENPLETEIGEELLALEGRIRDFLKSVREFDSLLVVGHGGFLRGLKSIIETGSIARMNQYEIKNGTAISLII